MGKVRPIKRDDKSTTTQIRERAIHHLIFLAHSRDTVDTTETTIDSAPVDNQGPPLCNHLASCPLCNMDITTGGLRQCHHVHRSLWETSKRLLGNTGFHSGNASRKFKEKGTYESDEQALERISRLLKNYPVVSDHTEELAESPLIPLRTVLCSGVSVL